MNEQETGTIDLAGRVALVTGGGRGLGRVFAHALAGAGASVALIARSLDELQETRSSIVGRGGICEVEPADVTRRDVLERAIAALVARLGPFDILVNNAGISGRDGAFWELPEDEWWHVFEVDVRGTTLCTHLVLPGMIERGGGHIINIVSDVGARSTPRKIDYACAKAAVMRFTDCLALACKPHDIALFALSPGLVHTRMTESSRSVALPPSVWTEPEVAARVLLMLVSGAADALTGRYIHARGHDIQQLCERAEKIARADTHVLRMHYGSPERTP